MNKNEGYCIIARHRGSNLWRPTGTRIFVEFMAIAHCHKKNEEEYKNCTGIVWDYAPAAEVAKWKTDNRGRYKEGGNDELDS